RYARMMGRVHIEAALGINAREAPASREEEIIHHLDDGNPVEITMWGLTATTREGKEDMAEADGWKHRSALAHSGGVFFIPLAGVFLIFPAFFWWCMKWAKRGYIALGRCAVEGVKQWAMKR